MTSPVTVETGHLVSATISQAWCCEVLLTVFEARLIYVAGSAFCRPLFDFIARRQVNQAHSKICDSQIKMVLFVSSFGKCFDPKRLTGFEPDCYLLVFEKDQVIRKQL